MLMLISTDFQFKDDCPDLKKGFNADYTHYDRM